MIETNPRSKALISISTNHTNVYRIYFNFHRQIAGLRLLYVHVHVVAILLRGYGVRLGRIYRKSDQRRDPGAHT